MIGLVKFAIELLFDGSVLAQMLFNNCWNIGLLHMGIPHFIGQHAYQGAIATFPKTTSLSHFNIRRSLAWKAAKIAVEPCFGQVW